MIAALVAVSIWALWIPVTRLGVTSSFAPLDLAALRFFTAALVLLPLLWRHFAEIPWHRPFALMWLIAGAGVPYLLAFGYGLKIANSGQGGILGPGAMPIFVAIFAALFLKETITVQRRCGIALGSAGVAFILGFDMAHGAVRLEGFFLILLASCLWATHTIASRSLALPPMTSTMIVSVGNGIVLLPPYAIMGGFGRLAAAPGQDVFLQAAFQGIIVSVVALVAFAFAIKRLGASSTGVFTPLAPVFAAAMGYFLLGDTLDTATIIGLMAVFCGVIIAVRAPNPVLPPPQR